MAEKYICYWCGRIGLEQVEGKTTNKKSIKEKLKFRCSNCGETWYFTPSELSQLSKDTRNHLEKKEKGLI